MKVRTKERYITAFKRDVENIVSAAVTGKELEEAIRRLYKKYIRNEATDSAVVKANENVRSKVDKLLRPDFDDDDIAPINPGIRYL
jgi:RNase P/RNase MRP subunit POP5